MTDLKVVVSDNDHRQGSAEFRVTLVEFGDYECPYCGEAYWVVKQLQQHFQHDLQFVFRNFPLAKVHPHAMSAAITAEFAGSHGFFWEVHDELYENQSRLGVSLFERIVQKHGLSNEALRLAQGEETYISKIKADFNGGVRSGVNGTPSFYIDGLRFDGPPDFAGLRKAIEFVLASERSR